MSAELETKSVEALLLYDGLCGVCNSAVQWILKRDHADRFRFAPQQSQLATEVLARHQVDRAAMLAANSVYLALHPGSPEETLLTQSDVTVHILLSIGGIWKVPGYLLGALPRFVRNAAYRLFARNRYRFSRQYATCPLPTAAVRAKFLA
jgi:predicted DCC family thiol-disulfide oxidoreductase YuxK